MERPSKWFFFKGSLLAIPEDHYLTYVAHVQVKGERQPQFKVARDPSECWKFAHKLLGTKGGVAEIYDVLAVDPDPNVILERCVGTLNVPDPSLAD